MDVQAPDQMHVDLGQGGVNDLDQTLHIDPILNQVAQAAEAEHLRQQEERQREQQQEHETMRDIEMPSGAEHESLPQHSEGARGPEFNIEAMDQLAPQDNMAQPEAAPAEDVQQEMRVDEQGEAQSTSRSPGQSDAHATSSAASRAAGIKVLISKLVKGVEDVVHEVASAESKVGEKVVWSL